MSAIETLDGKESYMIEACKGYGCIPADFMFVGISAGKLGALQTEVPLTKDMSGRLFQRVLYHLGLSKTADEKTLRPELVNCYVTNLVKGRILDYDGNNRLPDEKEIHFWMPALYFEIGQVQPKYIIALGDLVYKTLLQAQPAIQPLLKLKHPRAYGSRGAINVKTRAWGEILRDYQRVLIPQAESSTEKVEVEGKE